jgi:hypothetical protein
MGEYSLYFVLLIDFASGRTDAEIVHIPIVQKIGTRPLRASVLDSNSAAKRLFNGAITPFLIIQAFEFKAAFCGDASDFLTYGTEALVIHNFT